MGSDVTDEEYARHSPWQQQMAAAEAVVREAPETLWIRPKTAQAGWYHTALHDEPDAVRYVRADLYEALLARANQEPLGELGTDYPR